MQKRKVPTKKLNPKIGKKEQKSSWEDMFQKNILWITIGIIIFSGLIIAQVFRWQVIETEKFQTLATQQYTQKQRSASGRGIVYAADGSVLAIDEPSWGVYANLSNSERERELFFENKDKFVMKVSNILDIEEKKIEEQITEDFVYFPIKDGVSNDQKKALEETNIFGEGTQGFGLHFEQQENRLYPDGRLASHVLGFTGKTEEGEDRGNYGIEGYYWGDITGHDTYSYEEKDAQGNVILTVEYEPVISREGKDIKLTIDPPIQSKVEDVLREGVHEHRAKSGSAIIMNPETGAIIAMANYPDFNPNEYWKIGNKEIFKNRAVADVYEYGSTHKPITLALALEEDAIDTDYICHDQTGQITVGGETIHTWDKNPSGKLSLSEILSESNNPCIAKIGMKVGLESYYQGLRNFGIGNFIGVGLEDESNSYLKPYEEWTELDLAVTSFGQSISANSLQIISALSPFANNGERMRPYIVSKVVEEEDVIRYSPSKMNSPISEETANTVADYMGNVVTEGEARYIFKRELESKDYEIAGKTGTAQIPKRDEPGYYDDKTNATFVGFSPTKDAEMIMLVKLREPQTDIYAATTAVPVWINIFNEIAEDLEIPKK